MVYQSENSLLSLKEFNNTLIATQQNKMKGRNETEKNQFTRQLNHF